jgi:hypothetical protein
MIDVARDMCQTLPDRAVGPALCASQTLSDSTVCAQEKNKGPDTI